MDFDAMRNAYDRARESEKNSHYPQFSQKSVGNYSKPPVKIDDYIVVHKTDGTYAICRSRSERMFEYEELGIVRTHHEAVDIAKLLNEREGNK